MTKKSFSLILGLFTIFTIGTYTYITSAVPLSFDEISGGFYADGQSLLMSEVESMSHLVNSFIE